MPLILRLALVFASAVAAGLYGTPLYIALATAIIAAISSSWLASFAALGIALGSLTADHRNNACWRFRDGQAITFTAVLESLPASQKAVVRMLQPCEVITAARLPKNIVPPPGVEFIANGTWQSVVITNDAVARPGGGTLVIHAIDSISSNKHALLAWRAGLQKRIREIFPNYSGLTEALLVAQRDGLDADIRARYAASGLTHLLAISGTHVALVAAVLWLFARMSRLSRRSSNIACIAGTAAYVLFLGAPFAAVRALIQLVLLMIARGLQRPAHPLGLVAAAALFIIALHPHAIIDAGFQLSFSGIAAIILWRRPLIEAMPASVPTVLRDAVATTVAATLVTTPIAAMHFATVSVIALVANLFAIPAVSMAVPASAAAVAISYVSMSAGRFMAAGAEVSLASLDRVATTSANVPHGHFAAHPRQLTALFAPPIAPDQLEVHMIDVGQGDAVAIKTPGGKWILVDAGPASPDYDAGVRRVVPFLLRRGARSIDLLVITHPHLDHFGGARAILETFDVAAVFDPGVPAETNAYDSILVVAERRRTDWQRAYAGLTLNLDDVKLEFLHPDTILLDASKDPNDYSAVFRLSYGGFTALFLGDVSSEVEDRLMRRYGNTLDVDLLKVGHHGSNTSTSTEFLLETTPEVAMIGVGRRNRYRHPAPRVVDALDLAGAVVLRTDVQGNVTVRAHRNGRVQTLTAQ